MVHVIKHDMDPNSNINYRRKIPPMTGKAPLFTAATKYLKLRSVGMYNFGF